MHPKFRLWLITTSDAPGSVPGKALPFLGVINSHPPTHTPFAWGEAGGGITSPLPAHS